VRRQQLREQISVTCRRQRTEGQLTRSRRQLLDPLGDVGGVGQVAVVRESDAANRRGTERGLGVLPARGAGR